MRAEIVIASRYAPTYAGGLAAYQRSLARLLSASSEVQGVFLFEDSKHPDLPMGDAGLPWPLQALVPCPAVQASRSLWPHLAHRRAFHGPLIAGLERAWARPRLDLGDRREFRPRAIHFVGTGWDYCGFAFARWAASCGAKLTIWPAVHPHQWGDDRIDIRLYQRADTVFCQSQHEAEHLAALGLDPEKIKLCGLPPMGLEVGEGSRLRGRLSIGERPAVFFLGRRDEGKGYPSLVEAWKRVLASFPDAVLLLAGPPQRVGESSLLAALPADSYRDLALINERDKADAYAACDLFCLPSAHESFGIVYVEAWSHGKPVICGTAPASRELVEDGKTGLWGDQNPAALAERILFLLRERSQAQRMGEAGRQLQRTRYTEAALLQPHLDAWGMSAGTGVAGGTIGASLTSTPRIVR